MKTQSLIKRKDEFIKDHQLKIGGSLVLIILLFVVVLMKKLKANKLNQWLHSMKYSEENFKTKKIMYPKFLISKDKIVIKDSNLINQKEVEDKRESFEKFFQVQILDIRDEKRKTVIYISK